MAGAASRTATAPLEAVRLAVMTGTLESPNLRKVRSGPSGDMDLDPDIYIGLGSSMKRAMLVSFQGAEIIMEKGGGWKALFRGNLVNVMRR